MPFPESPRVVFQINPLTEVVCQLVFPPILAIGTGDPALFQDRIRQRYPLYKREERIGMPKEMADLISRLNVAGQLQTPVHSFSTADGSRTVTLAHDSLALLDHQYHRWEQFREELQSAKAALEEIYQPAFYTRTGLRYVDIIDRAGLHGLENEPWDSLLNPALVGALGAPQIRAEVQEIGTNAVIRIDEVPGSVVRLRYGLRTRDTNEGGGQVYVIDADFFTVQRSEPNNAMGILDIYNRLAGNLFRWTISNRLRDALQPVAI